MLTTSHSILIEILAKNKSRKDKYSKLKLVAFFLREIEHVLDLLIEKDFEDKAAVIQELLLFVKNSLRDQNFHVFIKFTVDSRKCTYDSSITKSLRKFVH